VFVAYSRVVTVHVHVKFQKVISIAKLMTLQTKDQCNVQVRESGANLDSS